MTADLHPHGIHPGVDEKVYFADPAFSQSQGKALLESPAKYRHSLDHPRRHKSAFERGSAWHTKVLGVGTEVVVIPESLLSADGGVRSAEARQWVKDARAAGQIPLKPVEAVDVEGMAEAVLAHPEARKLLELDAEREVSMWWQDSRTGVECRARVDSLTQVGEQLINLDLKSTEDARLHKFSKSVGEYGYHVQDATYDDGYFHLTGEHLPCVFIAVEKKPPYLVALFELRPSDVERGRAAWHKALDLLVECRATDRWPGHPEQIQTIDLPRWAA